MNRYRVTHKNLPGKNIFNPTNDGKVFISIDMRKANFSALYHYDRGIFSGAETWEKYVAEFTGNKHIISSKYFRQVVLGHCNPKRHITYEKYLMDEVIGFLNGLVEEERIVFFSNDEIVYDMSNVSTNDLQSAVKSISEVLKERTDIPLKAELFTLHKIDSTDGYYKEIFRENGEKAVEFKCLDNYMLPFVIRRFLGEKITDNDRVFYHEGLLAQFMEVPKIEL